MNLSRTIYIRKSTILAPSWDIGVKSIIHDLSFTQKDYFMEHFDNNWPFPEEITSAHINDKWQYGVTLIVACVIIMIIWICNISANKIFTNVLFVIAHIMQVCPNKNRGLGEKFEHYRELFTQSEVFKTHLPGTLYSPCKQ